MSDREEEKKWGIGDIISMLFGSALVVGIVGWIAGSGIFGEQISAAIKSFVNQFLPEDMQFDDGKPMENYLRMVAKNSKEFQALLENDTFGPGLSEATAKAIAKDQATAEAFLDALAEGLGEGGLESIVSNRGNLTFNAKLVKAMAKSALPQSAKELLFSELLKEQGGISESAANVLASDPQQIARIMAVAEKNGSSLSDVLTTFGAVAASGDLGGLVKLFGENNEVFRTFIEAFDAEQIQAIMEGAGEQMQMGANVLKTGNNLEIIDGVIQNLKQANLYDSELLGQALSDALAGKPASKESKDYLLKVSTKDISLVQPLLELDLSALPADKRAEAQAMLDSMDINKHIGKAVESVGGLLNQGLQFLGLDGKEATTTPATVPGVNGNNQGVPVRD